MLGSGRVIFGEGKSRSISVLGNLTFRLLKTCPALDHVYMYTCDSDRDCTCSETVSQYTAYVQVLCPVSTTTTVVCYCEWPKQQECYRVYSRRKPRPATLNTQRKSRVCMPYIIKIRCNRADMQIIKVVWVLKTIWKVTREVKVCHKSRNQSKSMHTRKTGYQVQSRKRNMNTSCGTHWCSGKMKTNLEDRITLAKFHRRPARASGCICMNYCRVKLYKLGICGSEIKNSSRIPAKINDESTKLKFNNKGLSSKRLAKKYNIVSAMSKHRGTDLKYSLNQYILLENVVTLLKCRGPHSNKTLKRNKSRKEHTVESQEKCVCRYRSKKADVSVCMGHELRCSSGVNRVRTRGTYACAQTKKSLILGPKRRCKETFLFSCLSEPKTSRCVKTSAPGSSNKIVCSIQNPFQAKKSPYSDLEPIQISKMNKFNGNKSAKKEKKSPRSVLNASLSSLDLSKEEKSVNLDRLGKKNSSNCRDENLNRYFFLSAESESDLSDQMDTEDDRGACEANIEWFHRGMDEPSTSRANSTMRRESLVVGSEPQQGVSSNIAEQVNQNPVQQEQRSDRNVFENREQVVNQANGENGQRNGPTVNGQEAQHVARQAEGQQGQVQPPVVILQRQPNEQRDLPAIAEAELEAQLIPLAIYSAAVQWNAQQVNSIMAEIDDILEAELDPRGISLSFVRPNLGRGRIIYGCANRRTSTWFLTVALQALSQPTPNRPAWQVRFEDERANRRVRTSVKIPIKRLEERRVLLRFERFNENCDTSSWVISDNPTRLNDNEMLVFISMTRAASDYIFNMNRGTLQYGGYGRVKFMELRDREVRVSGREQVRMIGFE